MTFLVGRGYFLQVVLGILREPSWVVNMDVFNEKDTKYFETERFLVRPDPNRG